MRDFKGMKRQRGRNRGSGGPSGGGQGGGKPSQNVNRAFDSNGPDGVKVRGHAQSVYEKYQQLARDAFSSGDRVLAENHLQHAEHYFRVLRLIQPQRPTAEIVARDVFASGFDIDFEDEGEEAAFEAPAEEARGDDRDAYGERARQDQGRGDQGRQDQGRQDQPRGDRANGRFGDRQSPDRQNGDRSERIYGGERSSGERSNGEREADRAGERPNADRQNGDRQNADRQNGDRQNGRGPRQNDRGERPRYEGRPPERTGGYGEQPREFGRDRPDARPEARSDTSRSADPALEPPRPEAQNTEFAGAEPRSEAGIETVRRDPMPVVEPKARPFTPPAEAIESARAPEPAEGSPVLRSLDGGVSEAPAFLQAFTPPVQSATGPGAADGLDEPVVKRPRGRPRKRPAETEDNAPAPAAEPEEV